MFYDAVLLSPKMTHHLSGSEALITAYHTEYGIRSTEYCNSKQERRICSFVGSEWAIFLQSSESRSQMPSCHLAQFSPLCSLNLLTHWKNRVKVQRVVSPAGSFGDSTALGFFMFLVFSLVRVWSRKEMSEAKTQPACSGHPECDPPWFRSKLTTG